MLVLTRKYQEKIRIGDNITITVLRMKGKAVRLGIEAPAEVPVVRGELSFTGESEPTEATAAPTKELEIAETETIGGGRTFGRTECMSTPWPTNSRPAEANLPAREQATTVSFNRVPREKVSNMLPKLVAGAAPLRAMMDQGRG